jgi:hypothetical protein
MGADFAARARFPTRAEILHVFRAFDAQPRAIILSAFAYVTGEQRRFVTHFGYTAGFNNVARSFHGRPATRIDQEPFG